MANNPKITKDGFIGNLQGIADSAKELKVVDLGIIAGNTIEQVRAKLKATLLGLERLSPIVTMAYDDELVSEWNSGNTSYIVKEGSRKIFIPLSVYGQTNYQSWLVSSYYKSAQRIVSLENGVWQPFVTLATNVDLSSLKSELESKISSTSHTLYKASQLLDYTSDDGGVTPAGVKKAFDGQLTAKKVTPAGDANRPVYINSSGVPTAIDSVLDGNVNWGGANRVGDFGPIDAAMIPRLGANRLAFLPAKCITIEYSRDGGATWTEGSYTDSEKTSFFTQGLGCNLYIGGKSETGVDKSTHQVRVTIHDTMGVIYNIFKKIALYVSTNGSKSCWCTIQGRLQTDVEAGTDTWTTFVDKQRISGWSGWNVINVSFSTYGNLDNKDSQYGNVRFTFGCESHDQTYDGLNIIQLLGFGGVGWSVPSNLAGQGTLYRHLADQQVIFPSYVNSDKGFAITGGSNSQVLLAGGGTASTSSLSVGSAESSKYLVDYGDEKTKLRIGYSGVGLTGATVQHFAAYDPTTHYIKDLSTGEAKVALGISDYSTVKSNASKGAEASASLVSVQSDVNTIKNNYVSASTLNSYVTKASVTESTAAPGWGGTGTVGTVDGKAFKVTLPGTVPVDKLSGVIDSSHLPSYVDDVLEYDTTASFPTKGETGKIYVSTGTNLTYRWSGTGYVEISPSIALGETSATAYRGDYGAEAYSHSKATGNPHGTTIAQISGLQTALDGKAAKAHSHAISDVTNLQSSLDGKAATSHNHDSVYVKKTTVTASTPTLEWGKTSNIVSVDGKTATVTMPGNPITAGLFEVKFDVGSDGNLTCNKTFSQVQSFVEELNGGTGSDLQFVMSVPVYGISRVPITQFSSEENQSSTFNVPCPTYPGGPTIAIKLKSDNSCEFIGFEYSMVTTSDYQTFQYMVSGSKKSTVSSGTATLYTGTVTTVTLNQNLAVNVKAYGENGNTAHDDFSIYYRGDAILRLVVGSTVYSVTWPSGLYWANGEVPTLEANTVYEFSFASLGSGDSNSAKFLVAYQAFKQV